MSHEQRRRHRRPARGPATKEPKRRLLVVCEGRRTEPDYIRGHQRHVQNATLEIEIPSEQGDPKRVVEIAKTSNQRANDLAKRQRDTFLKFDEVWCVFDRDDHERFASACEMARANGFELAVSNPCFELWLLLHFRENPGMQHREEIRAMLRSYVPNYDKRVDYNAFEASVPEAMERARRLDDRAAEDREPMRNPTTSVYRLIESISR